MKRRHLYAALLAMSMAAVPAAALANEEEPTTATPEAQALPDEEPALLNETAPAEEAPAVADETPAPADESQPAADAAEAPAAPAEADPAPETPAETVEDTTPPAEESKTPEEKPADKADETADPAPEEAPAKKTATKNTAESRKEFKDKLEKENYAEVNGWKVEKLKDGIYHMDEATKALPGGATDENGNMNNPSSIYFLLEEKTAMIIDGGNPYLNDEAKAEGSRLITQALTENKDVYFAFTHNHGDHIGLAVDPSVLGVLDPKGIWIHENDASSETIKKIFQMYDRDGKKGITHTVKDGDTIKAGEVTLDVVGIQAHTAGSVVFVSQEHETLFTGDSIGSGFVWLFWDTAENPIANLEAGCSTLQQIVQNWQHPSIFAGHRWQQFWEGNEQRPNEMSVQYLNDMKQTIQGLTNGSSKVEDYDMYANGLEVSTPGSKAKLDTSQANIDRYLDHLNDFKGTHTYVHNASSKLDINSYNTQAAATFIIYGDGDTSDEAAAKLLKDSGIEAIVDRSASKAIFVNPSKNGKYSAADKDVFMDLLNTLVGVSANLKLIGIGEGATFINNYLTSVNWMLSGIMTYGGEAGKDMKYTTPAYISGSDKAVTDQYVSGNKAEKTGTAGTMTTYVNPENRFEMVVENSAKEDFATAFRHAWDTVLSKFGRIGNYRPDLPVTESATWYMAPVTIERQFQYFDSADAVYGKFNIDVYEEDLNENGQKSLWYVQTPETATTEKGKAPVVVLMHGNTNDPRTQFDTSGWAKVAYENGIILISPEWQGHTFSGYEYEKMIDNSAEDPYVDFIGMLKKMFKQYEQIDTSRVYISGLSAGSRNTITNLLANPDIFAAGAGHSGAWSVNGAAQMKDIERNKDKFDSPAIFFTGDHDEYMMNGWDPTKMNNGLSCLNAFEKLNNMKVTTVDDLDEKYAELYGIPWDSGIYEVEHEGLARIIGGSMTNDKGVTIALNRIFGWGHWNDASVAPIMWEFMSRYVRDQETGEVKLYEDVYSYDHSGEVDIDSKNGVTNPTFLIYGDGKLTKEEADQLIADLGIEGLLHETAGKAFVINPVKAETNTNARAAAEDDDTFGLKDVDQFLALLDKHAGLNAKVIGIGQGATFVNQILSQYNWALAGVMLYGGEAGEQPKYSVPAYLSGSSQDTVADYIKANKATKRQNHDGLTGYVNPDSHYETVVLGKKNESLGEAFANAWKTTFSKTGRLGNIGGTFYLTPASKERPFQYYDLINDISDEEMKTNVVTKDLDGDGQLSLWYEYLPKATQNAAKGTVPVVFLMHGNGNDPRTQYETTGWAQLALEEGIILIAPEWQGHTFQGYEYDPMTEDDNATPDSDFIKLVHMMLEKYPQIDASRVYITGLSRGSYNTVSNILVNAKVFAAGAGHSGMINDKRDPNQVENIKKAVEANKDKYDVALLLFAGDKDENFTWDSLDETSIVNTIQLLQKMNNMPVTERKDLEKKFMDMNGLSFEEYQTIKADAENLCDILLGKSVNDKDAAIVLGRIKNWGHWNYPLMTRLSWEFMSQYARDPQTGELYLIEKGPSKPDSGSKKDKDPEDGKTKDETPSGTTAAGSTTVTSPNTAAVAETVSSSFSLFQTLSAAAAAGLLAVKKNRKRR